MDWALYGKAYLGGLMIGLASMLLFLLNGRIAGISGIVGSAMSLKSMSDRMWRLLFMAGLFFAAIVWQFAATPFPVEIRVDRWMLIGAGLLVGFGTRLGSGCTSGHGVCGIGRRSRRSITATVVFILSGVVTVAMIRWVGVLS